MVNGIKCSADFFFFVAYSYKESIASQTSPVLYVLRLFKDCLEANVEGARSFSTVDIHVERDLPFGRFQDHDIHVQRTCDVSWWLPIRATWWSNRVRRCLATILLSGWREMQHRISTLVMWSDQRTPPMRLKHHWSNPSILSLSLSVSLGDSPYLRGI